MTIDEMRDEIRGAYAMPLYLGKMSPEEVEAAVDRDLQERLESLLKMLRESVS